MFVDIPRMLVKSSQDQVVAGTLASLLLLSGLLGFVLSWTLGIIVITSFLVGCSLAVLLLNRKERVIALITRLLNYFEADSGAGLGEKKPCSVCGESQCPRHRQEPTREPWNELLVTDDLDRAVDSFFSRIISTFIESWFTQISNDSDFLIALKQNLREALSRVVLKLKQIDAPLLLTDKLLPVAFAHYELIQKLVADGIPMDKLAKHFQLSDRAAAIHPAVVNRNAELNYLRAVAKWLVPRLCQNDHFDSLVFFSLVRELFAGWALLPLMDVISDPNLINLLVIVATGKTKKLPKPSGDDRRVVFLQRFVARGPNGRAAAASSSGAPSSDTDILTDQTQLYAFMQFLKREGAVDVLRFYLDVDGLNADLMDPKVTTDPTKLSALQQRSETLLATWRGMALAQTDGDDGDGTVVDVKTQTLAEAHETVRRMLQGKWQSMFHRTSDYFRLVYGGKEIKELSEDAKDPYTPSGFRLSSKLKGALRSAVDGVCLDGTEVHPAAWDAFNDDSPPCGPHGDLPATNPTIYTSVTQKLRKERGQNLDTFIASFMQSVEFVPEMADDAGDAISPADAAKAPVVQLRKKTPPGRNLVFGDLFEMRRSVVHSGSSVVDGSGTVWSGNVVVRGPSKCLVFIMVHILNAPTFLVRMVLALITVSRSTVDRIVGKLINRIVQYGLYEPRLTVLITALEHHLFGPKQPNPTASELLERQRQAKSCLDHIRPGLSSIIEVLQSPPMNKQLMYSLMDIVLVEVYPELEPIIKNHQ